LAIYPRQLPGVGEPHLRPGPPRARPARRSPLPPWSAILTTPGGTPSGRRVRPWASNPLWLPLTTLTCPRNFPRSEGDARRRPARRPRAVGSTRPARDWPDWEKPPRSTSRQKRAWLARKGKRPWRWVSDQPIQSSRPLR
jgi:hypothetical protein